MSSNGPIVPSGIVPKIQFFEDRTTKWGANAANLGVTQLAVTNFVAIVAEARKKYDEAQAARLALKQAIDDQSISVRTMARAGSDLIALIKAYADARPTQAQRDATFALANLPVPTPPSAAPAPNTPTDLKVDPNADGTVTLKWKASGNAGAVYLVFRKNAGNTQFTQLGWVAAKKFVDGTVPAGTTSCQYYVQALRGAQTSPATLPVTVNFGAGGAVGFSGGQLGIAA